MIPVIWDSESFWAPGHTLSSMNPIDYCTHPETEHISLALKIGDGPTEVTFGEDNIQRVVDRVDWSDKWLIGHNMAEFDAMLAAWRCGVRPAMWGCTLAMARPHFAKTIGLSLGKLVEYFGLGVKDNSALIQTRGRHLKDFTPQEIAAMRIYNGDDTNQCAGLFKRLLRMTPPDELRWIDQKVRQLVNPQFALDANLLATTLKKEQDDKAAALLRLADMLGYADTIDAEEQVRKELASAPKFCALLESRGVPAPMKQSPTNPEKMIPALAKSDEDFLALQDHEDPVVAAAALCRLGVKSTQLETRIEKFLMVAERTGGLMPVPTRYYGAETTGRDSGSMELNMLNLPRVSKRRPNHSQLRYSLRAPKGKKVVVSDLSGIELRVNHFLWKVPSSIAMYQADPMADLYRVFAAQRYRVTASEITDEQRQMGKVAHLGLGFGAWWQTFQKFAKTQFGLVIPDDEALEVVLAWRDFYEEIVEGWNTGLRSIEAIHEGVIGASIDPWGLCHTAKDGIKTPRGFIHYPSLHQELIKDKRSGRERLTWIYGTGRHRTFLTGSKAMQNVVQHLARYVLRDALLAFAKTPIGRHYHPALVVYDEGAFVVPEVDAEEVLAVLQQCMRTPPVWWPELVVWSEGDIADTYGAAK